MKQRMRRLIGLMLAVVMILNLIPGGSVAVAADTIYTLTGLTASSTGVGQTGGMYSCRQPVCETSGVHYCI